MHNEHIQHINGTYDVLIWAILFLLLLILYVFATYRSNHCYKRWLFTRTISWVLGVLCIAASVIGPLANRAHVDFSAHMVGHLLLGMIAPLLIVLSAPMTLLLRSLNVKRARQLSKFLKTTPIRALSTPMAASLLNMGGLWILYTTNLYSAMHQNVVLYWFIHIHVFIAGYLFTASMIYIDPTPHRTTFIYRAIILVLASASHGILSKYLFINPPYSVPPAQAEKGAILMYYGGDAVDIILILILCLQWYKFSKPKALVNKEVIL